jgi:hypothetical protein
VVDALDALVLPGRHLRVVDALHQHREEDVADKRGLARTGHPGDGDEAPERDVDVDVLEVVLASTDLQPLPRSVTAAALAPGSTACPTGTAR